MRGESLGGGDDFSVAESGGTVEASDGGVTGEGAGDVGEGGEI